VSEVTFISQFCIFSHFSVKLRENGWLNFQPQKICSLTIAQLELRYGLVLGLCLSLVIVCNITKATELSCIVSAVYENMMWCTFPVDPKNSLQNIALKFEPLKANFRFMLVECGEHTDCVLGLLRSSNPVLLRSLGSERSVPGFMGCTHIPIGIDLTNPDSCQTVYKIPLSDMLQQKRQKTKSPMASRLSHGPWCKVAALMSIPMALSLQRAYTPA